MGIFDRIKQARENKKEEKQKEIEKIRQEIEKYQNAKFFIQGWHDKCTIINQANVLKDDKKRRASILNNVKIDENISYELNWSCACGDIIINKGASIKCGELLASIGSIYVAEDGIASFDNKNLHYGHILLEPHEKDCFSSDNKYYFSNGSCYITPNKECESLERFLQIVEFELENRQSLEIIKKEIKSPEFAEFLKKQQLKQSKQKLSKEDFKNYIKMQKLKYELENEIKAIDKRKKNIEDKVTNLKMKSSHLYNWYEQCCFFDNPCYIADKYNELSRLRCNKNYSESIMNGMFDEISRLDESNICKIKNQHKMHNIKINKNTSIDAECLESCNDIVMDENSELSWMKHLQNVNNMFVSEGGKLAWFCSKVKKLNHGHILSEKGVDIIDSAIFDNENKYYFSNGTCYIPPNNASIKSELRFFLEDLNKFLQILELEFENRPSLKIIKKEIKSPEFAEFLEKQKIKYIKKQLKMEIAENKKKINELNNKINEGEQRLQELEDMKRDVIATVSPKNVAESSNKNGTHSEKNKPSLKSDREA